MNEAEDKKLVKFQCEIPRGTKKAIFALFIKQGVIKKEGTTRIFQWLLNADPRIWPIVFGQVDEETSQYLLRMMLETKKKKRE